MAVIARLILLEFQIPTVTFHNTTLVFPPQRATSGSITPIFSSKLAQCHNYCNFLCNIEHSIFSFQFRTQNLALQAQIYVHTLPSLHAGRSPSRLHISGVHVNHILMKWLSQYRLRHPIESAEGKGGEQASQEPLRNVPQEAPFEFTIWKSYSSNILRRGVHCVQPDQLCAFSLTSFTMYATQIVSSPSHVSSQQETCKLDLWVFPSKLYLT